ncbi:MAG: PDDEXK nuclease domain-containing protein [Candidatus Cloacimonadales bacterium]
MPALINQSSLYKEIAKIITESKKSVQYSINNAMVISYWNIGKIIVEYEQQGKFRAEYGKNIIRDLAVLLSKEFGKGFDYRNLQYMKKFYHLFKNMNALSSQLSWTHYRHLLKVENEKARLWYMDETIRENWSTRALERQINSFYYERLLSSESKEVVISEARKKTSTYAPENIIKDPYVLEFLQLSNRKEFTENELETALLDELQDFLLELGSGFSFVARQKHIDLSGEHFYIDLVFYNYKLKCFVLIDLKRGKLTHQDIGQMDTYIRIFESKIKGTDDNDTIGIILCSDKNETVVKYSMLNDNKQLYASKYKLYLPTEEELKNEIDNIRAKTQRWDECTFDRS